MKTINIENLVRKNVLAMQPYSSARDEFQDSETEMIFLDANENPFENGVNRYPDPKQKCVKKVWSTIRNIEENQIIFGNGSDELLDLVYRAFCEPGKDNVITLPPTYGMYSVLANLNNVENREVLLDSTFNPNVSEIAKAGDENTKIIFLCSPNNPTGNSFSIETVTTLLEQFDGLVVIDEAYIDFSTKESWLRKMSEYQNLIILQTLSKAYGMAGIRLGILYADAQIISILDKIKPPYNINELTQQKALERITDDQHVKSEVYQIVTQKNILIQHLIQFDWIKKIYKTDANFILVKTDDADKRYNQLLENGIVVRNRSNQPLCENCLRITVGTQSENEKLIETMKTL